MALLREESGKGAGLN